MSKLKVSRVLKNIHFDNKTIFLVVLLFTVIIFIGYLIYINFNEKYTVIPEPKGVIKLQTIPDLFNKNPVTDVIFEPADIIYYQENPTFLENDNFIDIINVANGQIDIPNFDTQVVHDSYVQRSIRKLWEDVSDADDDTIKMTIKQIKKKANGHPDIIDSLDNMMSRNNNITNLGGVSELQVLNSVWTKIKDSPEHITFFMNNLKDTIENGVVVCPTGTTSRMISTLALDDPEHFPKTKEMITNEMLNTAAKVRQDLEKDSSYNEDTFKDTLIDRYTEDYKGILNKEEIQDTIKPWIDEI
jgi:hypothetical protein